MNSLFSLAGRDMAIDLGTANTLVFVRGQGIVLNEPSVVAINTRDNRPLEVGMAAKRMIGRTPSYIQAIRPLRNGVIADFDVTEKMLRYFIDKVHSGRFAARPRIVICVPSGITAVERRAVEEAAYHAGARRAYTIEEPMAAAIGVGLPVHEPAGSMVVDIGGGTTEVAVISLGGIVVSKSIRIGGDELDEAIITWVKKEYSLMLGERTAEQVKMAIGSAWPYADEPAAEVRGRDLISGLPKTIVLSSPEFGRPSRSPSRRSSTPSSTPSTRRLPSSPPTSWTEASFSPVEAHCYAGSICGWPTRPECRSSPQIVRCRASCWDRGRVWRNSTCSTSSSSRAAAPDVGPG